MAKYSRLAVLTCIQKQGLMPLFYHPDAELGKAILRAVHDGGGRLMEFTNRGDFAHEVFAELNKYALEELPGMMLGVGSIMDAATASLYIQLGANFIVSASLKEDIAFCCNRRKVAYMPGCGSLTEISRAEELGCEIVKLFPGGIYGPDFVKAIKGPQPWTSIMPTGGVAPTEDNLKSWFSAGVVCVGIGSKLISKEIMAKQDVKSLSALCRQTLQLIEDLR